LNVTHSLAHHIASTDDALLPAWAVHEAKRTLLNVLAISLSASRSNSAATLYDWVRAEGCAARASIIGGRFKTSPGVAALTNGFLAHLQDYDDTHFPTVLHPSAPVWPAILALAEDRHASGRAALGAFVLGAEAACRVAVSVHPWHYDAGWHITGTAGVLGAAAGAGRLLGLSTDRLVHALGIAGTFAAGVREVFGTHGKPLHAGHAAQNGLQSAVWAAAGFTGAPDILGGRRGFWAVLSPNGHSVEALLGDWGQRWELKMNGLKPYANGVVSHPIQDAVIELRNTHALRAEQIEKIEALVHPLVLELMNRAEPRRALEGKFSFQHCAAAALVDGAGHDAQFTDEKVNDPVIAGIRARVSATIDHSMREDETRVTITLKDGRRVAAHVAHATGSPENPMSDEVLERKFRTLAGEVLAPPEVEQLLQSVWSLDQARDIGELCRLMRLT
jgi:2-methylcitrate dehydratase PrpD